MSGQQPRPVASIAEAEPLGITTSSAESDMQTSMYVQLCSAYNAICDWRAKVLGFLPLASGAGIYFLLSNTLFSSGGSKAPLAKYLLPIGMVGAAVTLGLFLYDVRAIQLRIALVEAGQVIEDKAGLTGQFANRPHSLFHIFNDMTGSALIFAAVLAGWVYLGLSVTPQFAEAVALGLFLVIATGVIVISASVAFARERKKKPTVRSICTDAANAIQGDPSQHKLVSKRLQDMARREGPKWNLGVIETAETIRAFTYRGFQEESFPALIKAVGMLCTTTKEDYKTVVMVIADTIRLFKVENMNANEGVTDYLRTQLNRSHVLPQVFFQAFLSSHVVVAILGIQPQQYFDLLVRYLDGGVAPEKMYQAMSIFLAR